MTVMNVMTADDDALAEPMPGPAAHSMDTQWFGVDDRGHVARFVTNSRGAVPFDHRHGSANEVLEDCVGLFEFVHDTDWGAEIEYSDLYTREGSPAHARKIAELPVHLRSILEPLHLIGVDFRVFDRLQPAEHLPCRVWEGYMGSDGLVHPGLRTRG